MATVKKQGRGYKITVSNGYDINGKQLREHMTWIPDPGMTRRQIEKELTRQMVLFEEEVKTGAVHDGSIRFQEFTEIFMQQYAYPQLKAKTSYEYAEKLKRINQALGHIRLRDLKPGHINSFYANLREAGIRAKTVVVPKIDFVAWLKRHETSMAELSRQSGVSLWAFKQMKKKGQISARNASAIASAMGEKPENIFLIARDMTPLSPGTIHGYHRVLSAVLSKALKWGYIRDNPASRADLPSHSKTEAAYLDEPEARKLLELLTNEPIKWRTLITFDLLSGLRRGELLGLRWQDIDFDHQTISIRQTSNYIPTKGMYIDTPKTPTSRRPLRLSRSAFLLLLEYRTWQEHQRELLGDAWEGVDDRVFTNDFGAPIFPDSITRWFSDFVRRSGLPSVTVHSLRHTYASLMIAEDIPLVVVSRQLGHAQPSTTANIYAHVIASAEARATQTFDRFDDLIIPDKKAK